MRDLSYENEVYSQVRPKENQTHFHKKGFTLRLALKQRQKATWKWPIIFSVHFILLLSYLFIHSLDASVCNSPFLILTFNTECAGLCANTK